MFGWCSAGQHDKCRREYKKYDLDPKTGAMTLTGEIAKCECPKRGCKCYIKRADRTKTKTKRKG